MQPQGPRGAVLAALLAVTVGCMPAKAFAQGFFQSLFGGGAPQQSAPPPRPLPQPAPPAAGFGYRAPLYDPYQQRQRHEDDGETRESGGTFRTMCVRLCDGYYWPISQSVRRSSFHRDARACKASCGQEARLFFHASTSGDASEMVDQQGRAYTSLPTAFLHRKRIVDGCRCRPEPWSEAELSRHRLYAFNEARERLRQEHAQPEMAAGGGPAPEVVSGKSVTVTVLGERPAGEQRPAPSAAADDRVDRATPAAEPAPQSVASAETAAPAEAAGPRASASVGVAPEPFARRQEARERRTRARRGTVMARAQHSASPAAIRKAHAPIRHASASALGGPKPASRWPGD